MERHRIIAFGEILKMRSIRASRFAVGLMFMLSLGLSLARAQNPSPQSIQSEAEKRGLGVKPTSKSETSALSRAESKPELILQTGHSGEVHAVSFSRDGQLIASASEDQTIKLWEASTGRELRVLTGHTQRVNGAAFSPDGSLLVSGSWDKTAKLWEIATGKELFTFSGHDNNVSSVAFSPDGRFVASASYDNTIKLWDVKSHREMFTLTGHSAWVLIVAFSPDGRYLASGSKDNTIKLWEVATGREARTMYKHSDWVRGLAFTPDGRLLISGSSDHKIKLTDVATGKEVRVLEVDDDVVALAVSPNGLLLTARAEYSRGSNEVKLWELSTGNELRSFSAEKTTVWCLAFSPDSSRLAAACSDWTIKLWDVASGRELNPLSGLRNLLAKVAISSDGRYIASSSGNELIQLWGQDVRILNVGTSVRVISFSPDGRLLASGCADHTVKLWEVATGREVRALAGLDGMVSNVAFSSDGRLLASAGVYKIKVWDLATGRELRELPTDPRFSGLALSPDGRLLVEGNTIWDLSTGRPVRSLGPIGRVRSIHFSPDGRLLASGSADKYDNVKLWEVSTGREMKGVVGHNDSVLDVAFSPDGRLLASAGWDRTVKLWEVETGRELRSMNGHLNTVFALTFNPDGALLASAGWDGTIRIWDAKTGEPVATLVSHPQSQQWLVVTPDGLFDGSPATWQRILWRFGGNTFDAAPVEAFFSEYYYPGLLADILAGKHPKAKRAISQLDRRQPKVRLMTADGQSPAGGTITTRNVAVRIEVAEAPADAANPTGGGARDVRLFRNGSLVKVWRGDIFQGKTGKIVLETSVPIVAGENSLTVYAFNRDNIKSADATMVLNGDQSLKRAGTAYILAVGVNEYADPEYNLKYAAADAQAFAGEMRNQQTRLSAFAGIEVIPLLNQDATKANILEALKRLAGDRETAQQNQVPAALLSIKPAQPEDAVIVYFAGHGTAQQSRFYLIPHDLGYTGSRTRLSEAGLKTILAHSISDLDLEGAFEKVDAGQVLLVIDACNSGQALEAEEKRRGPMNSKGLAQLAYEKGMYILTAAQGYQAALEAEQLGHGYLTYALVEEGLKTTAADTSPKDGQVAVREWLDYATLRVPQMQLAKMKEARGLKLKIAFVDGEEQIEEVEERSLQRPRAFYRREPDSRPLIVARP